MCLSYKNWYAYVDYILAVVDPGGGASKNNVVLKMCFVNIYMQYSHTKYGNTEYFRSHLSIVLFPFFSSWGKGDTPSLFHPRSLLRVSNKEYLFFTIF